MQEVFEKIIEQFISIRRVVKNDEDLEWNRAVFKCTEIVRQASGCNNGWIPCSERFPEKYNRVLAHTDAGEYYIAHVNGCGKFVCTAECVSTVIENSDVIAWQPLPAPYQPSGDHKKKTNFDRCCESVETMAQIIDIAKIGWTKEQIMEWLQSEVEE